LESNDWKALSPRSSLPLKYDLLLGPHNGVSGRIQRFVEKELEAIKLFPLESLKTLKVKVFLISELGFCFDIQDLLIVWLSLIVATEDSHLLCNNAWI